MERSSGARTSAFGGQDDTFEILTRFAAGRFNFDRLVAKQLAVESAEVRGDA